MNSALALLRDDDLRNKVRGGDLSAVGADGLAADEKDVLTRLAAEDPTAEVEGFESSAFFSLVNMTKGQLSPTVRAEAQEAFGTGPTRLISCRTYGYESCGGGRVR
jgi:hypothetical protein